MAIIKGFKGFDKDLRCRGFAYTIGATFKHPGKVVVCPTSEQTARGAGGFHSCVDPFDVLTYYPFEDGNRFAVVEAAGEIERHHEDSKIAAAEITIKAEIKFPELLRR